MARFTLGEGVGVVVVHVCHNHEPHGGGTLTRNHGAPGKEDFVDAVSTEAISLDYRLFVFDEVVVPHLDGVSVMDTLVSNSLNFKASAFDHVNVPVERARGLCSGEDVHTHENTPK